MVPLPLRRPHVLLLLFFVQADDGIRDTSVTGVQTCALPICLRQAEQDDAADAERLDFGALAHQRINGHLIVAGHGADLAANAFAWADEERNNKLGRMKTDRKSVV